MDGNKENFSVTDQTQTVEMNTTQFSVEEIVDFLVRLPAFARKPVCKFQIEDQSIVGRLVHKRDSILYIKHHFGKKAVPYKMEHLQAIEILHL
jgi:hypothetical protein